VLAELLELAPAGLEQVDGEDFVEFALYGAPGELPALAEGDALVGGICVRVRGQTVADDWAERWRAFHEPVLVGGRVWVRPPWAPPREDALDLVIDPGQAFGTGAHPTTRMSLELLLELPGSGAPGREHPPRPSARGGLVDLGCGSGVLAIAAAKLGYAPVDAYDHDPAAIEATLENALANGVELRHVERLDLRERAAPTAPTVTANLVRPLLLRVAELVPEQPETLIASGLLGGEEEEVAAAFAPMRERRRLRSQGWSACLLTGPRRLPPLLGHDGGRHA
jgi:ribosomal protein L11 methyltransferase